MKPNLSSHRLVFLLAASFSLTVVLFLSSTAVSQAQLLRIESEARTLTESALHATERLANVRTELRRTEKVLRSVVTPSADGLDATATRHELSTSLAIIAENAEKYFAQPTLAKDDGGDEKTLKANLRASLRTMNASTERALQRLERGDHQGAAAELSARALPAVDSADAHTRRAAETNRRAAYDTVARIASLTQAWGLGVDVVSAMFALVTAYFVIRFVRGYWALVDRRAVELEHFAGRVAHDIRSPLGTVSFALELARRDPDVKPQTRKRIDRAIRTTQRVGQLVDGLLLFAMSGKSTSMEHGANVNEVLSGVVDDVLAIAEEKRIHLDFQPSDPQLSVACSPGVLVSMTANLLGNAIKYMGDASRREVVVRVRDARTFVCVEVHDTGPGIPFDRRSEIFLPHVRGVHTTIPGFGLGLATVRRLAEAHEGEVGLTSDAAVGSVFWFRLPKWAAKPRRISPATLG